MLGALEEFPATLMRSASVSAVSSFGVCAVRCLSHAFFRNNDESGDLCSDLGPAAFRDPPSEFRSTPREGATLGAAAGLAEAGVSIHAPAKGRQDFWSGGGITAKFRSTPREGATTRAKLDLGVLLVSIHAPAKGRRFEADRRHLSRLRFDPRPRERATMAGPPWAARLLFRSTPPRRGDSSSRATRTSSRSFDPRPREGATSDEGSLNPSFLFRSTPPRRGDTQVMPLLSEIHGFDPRPREGATAAIGVGGRSCIVSIHAPAKGRLRHRLLGNSSLRVSIHAPAKGRQGWIGRPPEKMTFRSTPPRRGDHRPHFRGDLAKVSIHAPAKGRLQRRGEPRGIKDVSIHAPAKGRRQRRRGEFLRRLFRSTPPRRGDATRCSGRLTAT